MENVVLGLLILNSLTLYDLNRAFKQGISMFYSASYGSLQIAVKKLLQKGLVVFDEQVDRGRHKKVYRITPRGRDAFREWMLAETPASKLEVTALAKVYFLGLIPEAAQRRQILTEILGKIEAALGELTARQAALRQLDIPASYQAVFRYQLATLDYGLRSHAVAREWCLALLHDLEAPRPKKKSPA
ncbi:MAG: PadR family transcriptional regulator [Anaerolineales bacterium]|nr:PadR family transcriptional regulator [Anaerolineales bacterium]